MSIRLNYPDETQKTLMRRLDKLISEKVVSEQNQRRRVSRSRQGISSREKDVREITKVENQINRLRVSKEKSKERSSSSKHQPILPTKSAKPVSKPETKQATKEAKEKPEVKDVKPKEAASKKEVKKPAKPGSIKQPVKIMKTQTKTQTKSRSRKGSPPRYSNPTTSSYVKDVLNETMRSAKRDHSLNETYISAKSGGGRDDSIFSHKSGRGAGSPKPQWVANFNSKYYDSSRNYGSSKSPVPPLSYKESREDGASTVRRQQLGPGPARYESRRIKQELETVPVKQQASTPKPGIKMKELKTVLPVQPAQPVLPIQHLHEVEVGRVQKTQAPVKEEQGLKWKGVRTGGQSEGKYESMEVKEGDNKPNKPRRPDFQGASTGESWEKQRGGSPNHTPGSQDEDDFVHLENLSDYGNFSGKGEDDDPPVHRQERGVLELERTSEQIKKRVEALALQAKQSKQNQEAHHGRQYEPPAQAPHLPKQGQPPQPSQSTKDSRILATIQYQKK